MPKLSEVLRKVSLPIWRNKECQEAFSKAKFNFTVQETQLCAGSYGKDSCDVRKANFKKCLIYQIWFLIAFRF